MGRDPRAYLWDAREAAKATGAFSSGEPCRSMRQTACFRSAVERQFEIVGEALNQLAKAAPDVAAQVADLPRIVAFRNILIHGYAVVDNVIVWRVVQENLPALAATLERLLAPPDASA
jgi:uncharacterized protein with HEPN domain